MQKALLRLALVGIAGASFATDTEYNKEATDAFNYLQDKFHRPHVSEVIYVGRSNAFNWVGPLNGFWRNRNRGFESRAIRQSLIPNDFTALKSVVNVLSHVQFHVATCRCDLRMSKTAAKSRRISERLSSFWSAAVQPGGLSRFYQGERWE